jgi:putative membrane protein
MRGPLLCSFLMRPLLCLLSVGWLVACSPGGGGKDAVESATAENENKISAADVTDKQEADAEFLVKTTSNALLEVELGKLAQARAATPAVRAYGTRLVQTRPDLLASLRTLADAKKLALPAALGADEQAAYHEVNTKAGNELDKSLMKLLVKMQKQDDNAFDDMKDDAYDGDIRGLAAKYQRPMSEELDGAKEVADATDDLP